MFDACLNAIFRVALKAISWASGVELNYTEKRYRFITFTNFLFLSRFWRFLVLFEHFYVYQFNVCVCVEGQSWRAVRRSCARHYFRSSPSPPMTWRTLSRTSRSAGSATSRELSREVPTMTPTYTLCPQKSEPLNILQQPPQTCTDLDEILHTQDDIYFCHRRQIS